MRRFRSLITFVFSFLLLAPLVKADEPILPTFYLHVYNEVATVTIEGFDPPPAEMYVCRYDESGAELPCGMESVTWSENKVALDASVFYFGGYVSNFSLTESAEAYGWYITENDNGDADGFKLHPQQQEPESFTFDVINGVSVVTVEGFDSPPAELRVCHQVGDQEGPCAEEEVIWDDNQTALAPDVFYFGGYVSDWSLSDTAAGLGWFVTMNFEGKPDGVKRPLLIQPEPVYITYVPAVIR